MKVDYSFTLIVTHFYGLQFYFAFNSDTFLSQMEQHNVENTHEYTYVILHSLLVPQKYFKIS